MVNICLISIVVKTVRKERWQISVGLQPLPHAFFFKSMYYVCEQNVISVYFCISVSLFDVELRI